MHSICIFIPSLLCLKIYFYVNSVKERLYVNVFDITNLSMSIIIYVIHVHFRHLKGIQRLTVADIHLSTMC